MNFGWAAPNSLLFRSIHGDPLKYEHRTDSFFLCVVFFVGWFLCLRRSKFRFRICHYQFNRRRSLPLYQLFMVLVCLFICSLSKVHGATRTASYHNFKGNHRANNVNVNVSLWVCEYFSHDEVAMCIVVIREREKAMNQYPIQHTKVTHLSLCEYYLHHKFTRTHFYRWMDCESIE